MFNSPIDEIKDRLDIVEVIGSYIKLQKTGANFRAICPFHSEKKPSFFVSPARQIWHCFGCGVHGDIFGFIMQIEGVEFGDALKILAQKAGVELKPKSPEFVKWQTERQRLQEVCELATRFFEKQLQDSASGKEAKKYLLSRGLSEDSIKKWRLGYSPDTWQGLTDFLVGKGYKKEEITKAGLAVEKESNIQYPTSNIQSYDRFRGRIIFPIFDLNSQVVGFGGRVFKERDKAEVAKYVNTPNTLLYDKSRILYGLDKAKVEIRKKDSCILVEGYTDVIMANQAGTPNVVATSGTALTPHQLKLLKRYSENLILGFDMDVAGESATKRGIDMAQIQGFNIRIALLEKGKDAADIIQKDKNQWLRTLEEPKSILEFYFQSAFSGRDPETVEGKKEISRILFPVLKKIPNQIEKSYWVQRLAKELGIKEEDILTEMKKVKLKDHYLSSTLSPSAGPDALGLEPEEIKNLPPKTRKELLEERLATLILKFPQNINLIEKDKLAFFSPQIQEIFNNLEKNQQVDSDYFNYLALKADIEEIEEKDVLPEIQFCLKEIQSLEIKSQMDRISQEIKKAESEKDSKKIENLTQQFNQLSKLVGL